MIFQTFESSCRISPSFIPGIWISTWPIHDMVALQPVICLLHTPDARFNMSGVQPSHGGFHSPLSLRDILNYKIPVGLRI
jgi:hypothetical protein